MAGSIDNYLKNTDLVSQLNEALKEVILAQVSVFLSGGIYYQITAPKPAILDDSDDAWQKFLKQVNEMKARADEKEARILEFRRNSESKIMHIDNGIYIKGNYLAEVLNLLDVELDKATFLKKLYTKFGEFSEEVFCIAIVHPVESAQILAPNAETSSSIELIGPVYPAVNQSLSYHIELVDMSPQIAKSAAELRVGIIADSEVIPALYELLELSAEDLVEGSQAKLSVELILAFLEANMVAVRLYRDKDVIRFIDPDSGCLRGDITKAELIDENISTPDTTASGFVVRIFRRNLINSFEKQAQLLSGELLYFISGDGTTALKCELFPHLTAEELTTLKIQITPHLNTVTITQGQIVVVDANADQNTRIASFGRGPCRCFILADATKQVAAACHIDFALDMSAIQAMEAKLISRGSRREDFVIHCPNDIDPMLKLGLEGGGYAGIKCDIGEEFLFDVTTARYIVSDPKLTNSALTGKLLTAQSGIRLKHRIPFIFAYESPK